MALAGCGGSFSDPLDQAGRQSISNTPEQAVKDYFQAVNDNDCEKAAALTSANLNLTGEKGASREEELRACEQSFAIVQGKPPLNEVKIDETVIGDNTNRAAIRGELTLRNDTKQVTDEIIVRLIVEDGMWVLDKITFKSAPNLD